MSFSYPIKVYYADTDAAQIAYHGRYVSWLEQARIEFLDAINCPYPTLLEQNISLIPVTVKLDYKSPLKLFDRATISLTCTDLNNASLVISHTFIKDDQVITSGYVKLACLHTDSFKPRKLPEELVHALQ